MKFRRTGSLENTNFFWKKLRAHRRGAEVSQKRLAAVLGMDQGSLSRAEGQGKAIPPRVNVISAIIELKLDRSDGEELLALAGYAPRVSVFEQLLSLMRNEIPQGQLTQVKRELLYILNKILAAMKGNEELAD